MKRLIATCAIALGLLGIGAATATPASAALACVNISITGAAPIHICV